MSGIMAEFAGIVESVQARSTRAGNGILSFHVKPFYRAGRPRSIVRCCLWTDDAHTLRDLLPAGARVHIIGWLSLGQWRDADGVLQAALSVEARVVTLPGDADGTPARELHQLPGAVVAVVSVDDREDRRVDTALPATVPA